MQDKKQHTVELIFDGLMQFWKVKTLRELAEKLEVKEGTLNAWKSRGNIPKPEIILNKCKGISANWLLTGEGQMTTATEQEAPPANGAEQLGMIDMVWKLKMLEERMAEKDDRLRDKDRIIEMQEARLKEYESSTPQKKRQQS